MGMTPHEICREEVIPADGLIYHFPLAINAGDWKWATLLVNANVGAGAENVAFTADVALNPTGPWHGSSMHDLREAATNKLFQFTEVAIMADTLAALIGLSNPAPYLRVNIRNTGANPATITILIILSS